MTSFSEHLEHLPRLQGVFKETIRLEQPFEHLAQYFAQDAGTVLLLSGSSSDASRYNILALDPWLEITSRQETVRLKVQDKTAHFEMDPFTALDGILERFAIPDPDFDMPVHAGLFGYFSYDLKDRIEDLPITCQDTFLPDLCLYAPSIIVIQDKETGQASLMIPCHAGMDSVQTQAAIESRRGFFFDRLDAKLEKKSFQVDGGLESSFTKEEYICAVTRIIDYLRAGDIYQANLSQRFETGFFGNTYSLFLDLYERNPASFFSYVNAGDHHIVSTSPERFIQQCGRFVETRPIKGTIARGADQKQDTANRLHLSQSIKDDAELTMIVDLMRNDLSRVTVHESVVVKEHKRLEPYENVFHLVSIVEGELKKNKTSVDLLKATFPGGSITGCPKIRSMEIIDELEPVKRHVYTGSIGYISFHDTMDLSIAIRTATIANNRVFFSVGGGIVYDSDPEKEFQETLDKGKTLMDTLMSSRVDSKKTNRLKDPGGSKIKCWVDGKIIDQDKAVVPAVSAGFQYGAGLFETIKVENGQIFRLAEHVSRLNRSWKTLFSTSVPDITWEDVIFRLVRENQFEDKSLAVKLILSRSELNGGGLPASKPFFLAAFVREYIHRLDLVKKIGLDLVTYPEPRQSPLADQKTLNYLYYDRAGKYARTHQADEAIVLNPDQTVSETNTANIFAINGKDVIVPRSDHVLGGVTSQAALSFLSDNGYQIHRQRMASQDFYALPNIILTNALMGAVKVLTIDAKPIQQEQGVCSRINQSLFRTHRV